MTLEGINSAKTIMESASVKVAETESEQQERMGTVNSKLNSVYGDEIKPKTEKEGEISYIPKDPAGGEVEKEEKMSRKEAKKWLKQYREENDCSKKEAKAAFEAEFGYEFPDSKFVKYLRNAVLNGSMFGVIVGAFHTGEERDNFVETGRWNS